MRKESNPTKFYKFIDNTIFGEIISSIITIARLSEYDVYIQKDATTWAIFMEKKDVSDYTIYFQYRNNICYKYILENNFIYNDEHGSINHYKDPATFKKILQNLLEEL